MKKLDTKIKMDASIISKNIYYPPGGILMWIIIFCIVNHFDNRTVQGFFNIIITSYIICKKLIKYHG